MATEQHIGPGNKIDQMKYVLELFDYVWLQFKGLLYITFRKVHFQQLMLRIIFENTVSCILHFRILSSHPIHCWLANTGKTYCIWDFNGCIFLEHQPLNAAKVSVRSRNWPISSFEVVVSFFLSRKDQGDSYSNRSRKKHSEKQHKTICSTINKQ